MWLLFYRLMSENERTETSAYWSFFYIIFWVVMLTDFVAYRIIEVLKPSFLASNAVLPTQKSKAKPTTTTYVIPFSFKMFSSWHVLSKN